MTSRGHRITNYIDDLIGHGVQSQAYDSFNTLIRVLHELGFQINDKKTSNTNYPGYLSGS